MAIIKSSPIGRLSKSIGNLTYFDCGDKNVVRRKVINDKNRNKKSKKQIAQQKRFKYTSEFAHFFQSALQFVYPGKSYSHQHNMFIKYNKNAVTCDTETFITEIDFSKFLCCDGDLISPEITVKVEDEKSVFTVEFLKQKITPFSRPDDDVYIMFLNPEIHRYDYITFHLGKRGEPQSQTFSLLKSQHYSMVYAFAVSANRKHHSPSVFMQLELDQDYISLKNYPDDYEVLEKGKILKIPPSNADLKILEKINSKTPKVTRCSETTEIEEED